MNDSQKTVFGVAAVALLIAILFFIPWRMEPSGELAWAPIYRQPMSEARSYATDLHDTALVYESGEIAVGAFALEILANLPPVGLPF